MRRKFGSATNLHVCFLDLVPVFIGSFVHPKQKHLDLFFATKLACYGTSKITQANIKDLCAKDNKKLSRCAK